MRFIWQWPQPLLFWYKEKARSSRTSIFLYKTRQHHMSRRQKSPTNTPSSWWPTFNTFTCSVQCGFQFHCNLANLLRLKRLTFFRKCCCVSIRGITCLPTQHHIPDNLNCQQDHHGNLKFYSYTYLISKSFWWNTLHAGLYMSRNKLRFVAVSNICSTMSLNSNNVMFFCVLGLSESFTSSSSSSFWLPTLCPIYLKTWTQK